MIMDTAALLFLCALMLICLFATVLFLLRYIGILHHVEVTRGKPAIGNVWIAYKDHVGPYEKCGPDFTEVSSVFDKMDCIGIYYDNPKEVSSDKLRYVVGAVVSKGEEKPSETTMTLITSKKFKIFKLPAIDDAVTAEFPHIMNVSAILGAKKVYPALEAFIQYRKLSAHPFIEYYTSDKIHYFAPLSQQSDFFVEEVKYGLYLGKESEEGEADDVENEIQPQTNNTSDEESQGTSSSFEEIFADQVAQSNTPADQ